jgi:ABC-2 type transport system permease protein
VTVTPGRRDGSRLTAVSHRLRVLTVIASSEFKLKYAGSVLGYVWSVLRPLALFTLLYLVFGRVFRLDELSAYYPVSLLIGIVLFTFVADATTLALISIVARDSLIRKLAFPRIIVPASTMLTAAMTLAINLTVVGAFIAVKRITPRVDWLLLLPLLLELAAFTLGVGLLLAALFVRLRDLQQVWELVLQLFFYACPIIYPVGFLPPWGRKIIFLNPFTQILQDIRSLLLYPDKPDNRVTAATAFGSYGRVVPIAVALGMLAAGYLFFRREEPWFAERT